MVPEEQFTWSIRDGVGVVHPLGEIDLSTVQGLRDCCQAAIGATGSRIVVDLARTSYLDSTALGELVRVAKRLQADGGWLRLASVNQSAVRKVLAITALEPELGDYPNVQVAIEA